MKDKRLREMALKTVACCGLICALDSCFEKCGGCRAGKGCGDNDCFHKNCCAGKGLYGCWECPDFPCGMGYFSEGHPSRGQFVGCVQYIRKAGLESYVNSAICNIDKGFKYGLNGAYADKSEAEVVSLLENHESV
jgi:hypothetical protein